MSLQQNLDFGLHLQLGQVLAVLRQQGVLLVGSGMSYHNIRSFGQPQATHDSEIFDSWLTKTIEQTDFARRTNDLMNWSQAPSAAAAYPRAEHFIPLLVTAGAAMNEPGHKIFSDQVMAARISAYQFGMQAGVNP